MKIQIISISSLQTNSLSFYLQILSMRIYDFSDYYTIKTIITKTAHKRQLYIFSYTKSFPDKKRRLPGKI